MPCLTKTEPWETQRETCIILKDTGNNIRYAAGPQDKMYGEKRCIKVKHRALRKYAGVRTRVEGAPWRGPKGAAGDVSGVWAAARHRLVLLLHRGQRHKSESIDFPPCREAENCHVESTDLGTHTKTTIPPGPPRHGEERGGCKTQTRKRGGELERRKKRKK